MWRSNQQSCRAAFSEKTSAFLPDSSLAIRRCQTASDREPADVFASCVATVLVLAVPAANGLEAGCSGGSRRICEQGCFGEFSQLMYASQENEEEENHSEKNQKTPKDPSPLVGGVF